uniref:Uncharacterized protein n=1 Tax=Avena sativa TaxID=4498 RepID=A0ACD5UW82_AVESA
MATPRRDQQFPAGMRVLAVDDDRVCLKVLETLLRRCQYEVTTTDQAAIALKMLRENRDMFDLVISDVHMPGMDGFQLLEVVGHEMDLPVIMLSVNGETKSVMKGITHGACDYLLKPVRIEELTNIWQHVVRRKLSSADSHNVYHQVTCGLSEQSGMSSKKRKEYHSEEEDEDVEPNFRDNDKTCGQKRPRIVWTVEMHAKFASVVSQLGIDKAVPKRIVELMNIKNLTRENVATLSSYSAHGYSVTSKLNQQSAVVAQGVSVQHAVSGSCTDANMYHLSLPGNIAQAVVPSLRPAQLEQEWMSADSGDLFAVISGSSPASGMPRTLEQRKLAIQPSIKVPSSSLELLQDTVGASFISQQSVVPLSEFSDSRLSVHGSFNSNDATRLGDTTFASSANIFRLKANESSANSLIIGPKIAKSSSQLPSTVGAQHSIDQRCSSMFAQTSAGVLFSGDTSTDQEPSISMLLSEFSSSTCSSDGLLDSVIKFKVDKGEVASGDDLWCDFYPNGACM